MQGSTESSLAIWTAFNNVTTAYVRILKHSLKISWKRATNTSAFAVVGTSVINGVHIIQGLSGVLTSLDAYEYVDETDKLVSMTYDRILQEPLGGISQAIMDVELENSDDRFTPNQNTTIGTSIVPKRPIHQEVGFLVSSQSKTLSVFKGLTKQPRVNEGKKTVSIYCTDLVGYLYSMPMDSELYTAQRSDEIIADILTTLGFGSSQYVLDTGLNTIGYAWFDKTQTAGERIKKVCEAEEGYFYADENGILRFENRDHYEVAPHDTDVWDIDTEDIISWESDESTPIYNKITVKAKPREVQASQDIWTDAIEEEVAGSGGTLEIWANLDDPVTAVTDPAATTDYTAYTATGGGGSNITSDQVVGIETFATAVKITLTNNNASTAYYNLLKLRGTPATVVGEILKSVEDATSIDKYDEQSLVVENDFIESSTFANTLATALLAKYKDPTNRVILTVQGIPQLQLRDRIRVQNQLNTLTDYRVMRIQGFMQNGYFSQKLHLREVTSGE